MKKPLGFRMTSKTQVLTLVCDASGSMQDLVAGYVDGLNELLDAQVKAAQEQDYRLMVNCLYFSSKDKIRLLYPEWQEGASFPRFSVDTYPTDGMTALYDGIGAAIELTKEYVDKLAAEECQIKPTIIVQTDGQENCSREFGCAPTAFTNRTSLPDLIKQRENEGWIFTFLSADMSSAESATMMGFRTENTLQYNILGQGNALRSVSAAVTRAVTGATQGVVFSGSDRMLSEPRPAPSSAISML